VTERPALFAGVLRAEAGLRLEKLAKTPGLSPRATQRSEPGRYPHKDTVQLLAEPLQPCYARYLAGRVQIS
jgi:hypothetical protein